MTLTWGDLYPSKIVRDRNGKTATRIIRVYGDENTQFDQSNVFDGTVSGLEADTLPLGGIPQRGDFYPGDTSMRLDGREVVSLNGPSDLVIRLDYSQVTWGDVDTFYPGDDDAMEPPFIDLRVTGQYVTESIPRVLAIPFLDGNLVYNYSILTFPEDRYRTTITATFHRQQWGKLETFAAEDQYGTVHTDLSFEGVGDLRSSYALFTDATATQLGKGLYRITYRWVRDSDIPGVSEETISIPGNSNPARLLARPQVDAHTNLTPLRRPFETVDQSGGTVQLDAEPLLINSKPIGLRPTGTTTDLPGLTYASIDI